MMELVGICFTFIGLIIIKSVFLMNGGIRGIVFASILIYFLCECGQRLGLYIDEIFTHKDEQ